MPSRSYSKLKKLMDSHSSASSVAPSKKIPPHIHFRHLLQSPRPRLDLDYTFPPYPKTKFEVQSLKSNEYALALHRIETQNFTDVTTWLACEIIALSLCDRATGLLVFESANQVASLLSDRELYDLAASLIPTFSDISPLFTRVDYSAWISYLKTGARHRTNINDAWILGSCREYAFGFSTYRHIDRPDLYWGIPLAELTDASWMAFRAAADVVAEERAKQEKK